MGDLSLFEMQKTPLKIDKPIRLIELFAGVGSQAKALERLGANFSHYRISEWEVNATASYKAIHKANDGTDYSEKFTTEELTEILFNIGISTDGKKPMSLKEIARKGEQWKRTVYNNFKATKNIGSILNIKGADLGIVDTDKYCYIMTYSFPCQDLSLAGKGKGMAKGDNTRSGLLWEVERLLNECEQLPQILLMENVTQVHGTKNKEHFDEWIAFLESKGYSNYWKDLNAKNFGIPQNRKRCYMVSTLGRYSFEFPKPIKTDAVIKDFITDFDGPRKVNKTLLPYFGDEWKQQYSSSNGCIKVFDGECQGVFKSDYTNKRIYSMYGVCPTITTHNSINISELKGKLNVSEQWKLMGFDEDDYTKVSKTNTPEGELKKQVGNSIVVDVLCYIFKQML